MLRYLTNGIHNDVAVAYITRGELLEITIDKEGYEGRTRIQMVEATGNQLEFAGRRLQLKGMHVTRVPPGARLFWNYRLHELDGVLECLGDSGNRLKLVSNIVA